MDLSIIIVNWNSKDFLKKCLDSIFAQTTGLEFEVIVIDSASFDGCDRMVSEGYPGVRFIQSAENLGFSRANNRAFQEATGQCVLFLNPDTEVVGPAIRTLHAQLMSLAGAGIVGARLLNSDGTLQTSCVQSMPTILNKVLDSELLRAKWPKSRLWGTAALFENGAEPSEVDAISGACLMMKAGVFRQVGGFSDDYFMYAEDIDLAYKTRCAGYRNYYVPTATVVHHGGNSSEKAASTFATVMMPEATLRFFRKTRGRAYANAFRCGMCVSAMGRLAVLTAAGLLGASAARAGSRRSSVQKWQALFRWSVKQDAIVRRYYPILGSSS